MLIYAPSGPLRKVQVAGDIAVVLWCAFWIWAAFAIHDAISALARPGTFLVDTSGGISGSAERLPGLLSPVEGALDSLANGLRGAGDAQIEAVSDLALFVAVFVVIWPVLPVLSTYLVRRALWVRTARGISLLMKSGKGFEELLARRALVNQPLHKLAAVSTDPVGDIRSGNFAALAKLEARRFGIRPRR